MLTGFGPSLRRRREAGKDATCGGRVIDRRGSHAGEVVSSILLVAVAVKLEKVGWT